MRFSRLDYGCLCNLFFLRTQSKKWNANGYGNHLLNTVQFFMQIHAFKNIIEKEDFGSNKLEI